MKLYLPEEVNKEDIREMYLELKPGMEMVNGCGGLDLMTFDEWIIYTVKSRVEGNTLDNYVPSTVYILVDNNRLIGFLDIRHYLNENLIKLGGHIGYSIRPSERLKGYGNEILKMGIKKAKSMGIDKILLTAHKDNIGSNIIIKNNGGVLDNEKIGDIYTNRYWVY